MDRTDLDIPESTVWPESDGEPQAPVASQERLDRDAEDRSGQDRGAGSDAGAGDASGEQSPLLEPDAEDNDRPAKL